MIWVYALCSNPDKWYCKCDSFSVFRVDGRYSREHAAEIARKHAKLNGFAGFILTKGSFRKCLDDIYDCLDGKNNLKVCEV